MATGTTKRPASAGAGTARKTTARKTATRKTPAKTAPAKPAPAARKPRNTAAVKAAAPEPVVVKAAPPAPAQPDLRKRELIDMVVEQSGVKKKDAKPAVEAMLAILGDALASGRELNLQPFGKLRINRAEDRSNGRIIICKLRQAKGTGEKSGDD